MNRFLCLDGDLMGLHIEMPQEPLVNETVIITQVHGWRKEGHSWVQRLVHHRYVYAGEHRLINRGERSRTSYPSVQT